ncbi:MAG: DUF739 family protein [Veillonellaceae bacterium]|nr:DUF739 family protein [Veillonellaceae bacterium]
MTFQEYDFSKLRGRIKEKYGSESSFAKAMGMTNGALSQRLNNAVEFKQSEIYLAIKLLSIPEPEISKYFFAPKVQFSLTSAGRFEQSVSTK